MGEKDDPECLDTAEVKTAKLVLHAPGRRQLRCFEPVVSVTCEYRAQVSTLNYITYIYIYLLLYIII